ncbi:hypothetical protein AGMMS50239_39370 [Bacteroidia bacterium]|nr:hypothetical protein AGMMS50239_39370 [Bacteroidia bacterium]
MISGAPSAVMMSGDVIPTALDMATNIPDMILSFTAGKTILKIVLVYVPPKTTTSSFIFLGKVIYHEQRLHT